MGARAGCIHPQAIHHSAPGRSTHKATPEELLWRHREEEKDPAGTAGKHSGNQHTLTLATSNGLPQTEKPFLGTWPESKPLRGSGSMKAKDQQQKDTNPSPKWYFMAIKQPRQAHQGSSPCL